MNKIPPHPPFSKGGVQIDIYSIAFLANMGTMAKTNIIPATRVQNNFGRCLARVRRSKRPVLIGRHGEPAAVLICYSTWKKLAGPKYFTPFSWTEIRKKLVPYVIKRFS